MSKVVFENGYFYEIIDLDRPIRGFGAVCLNDVENAKEVIKQLDEWIDRKETEKREKQAIKSFYRGIKKW